MKTTQHTQDKQSEDIILVNQFNSCNDDLKLLIGIINRYDFLETVWEKEFEILQALDYNCRDFTNYYQKYNQDVITDNDCGVLGYYGYDGKPSLSDVVNYNDKESFAGNYMYDVACDQGMTQLALFYESVGNSVGHFNGGEGSDNLFQKGQRAYESDLIIEPSKQFYYTCLNFIDSFYKRELVILSIGREDLRRLVDIRWEGKRPKGQPYRLPI